MNVSEYTFRDYAEQAPFAFFVAKTSKWIPVYPLLTKCTSQHPKTAFNSKTLYLFDDITLRNNKQIDRAIKTISIIDHYNIYEYRFDRPKSKDKFEDNTIMINGKYLLKCVGDNYSPQHVIHRVIETLHFVNSPNDTHSAHLAVNDSEQDNEALTHVKYKYKPVFCYEYFRFDDMFVAQDKAVSKIHNGTIHIPVIFLSNWSSEFCCAMFLISISLTNYKRLNDNDLINGVKDMLHRYYFMIDNLYFDCQVNKDDKYVSPSGNSFYYWKISITARLQYQYDAELQPSTTPVLSGMHNADCDDNKLQNFENKENQDVESKNNKKGNKSNKESKFLCVQGLTCPIYLAMKNDYQHTQNNYQHCYEYNHFGFDYNNKPECRFNTDCKAFRRMARLNENSKTYNCYRFDDKCHL